MEPFELEVELEGLPSLPQEEGLQDWTGKSDSFISNILNAIEMLPATPFVEITNQPKPKDHRFRYPCEGRTAGALLGVQSTERRKTAPEVKIVNLSSRAMIIGSLVTKEGNKPHPFKLVGQDCENGIVKKIVCARNPKAKFESLGIQCVKRSDLKESLETRKNLRVDPFNNIDDCLNEDMQSLECRVVRICFQAYLEDPNSPGSFNAPLDPELSDIIYNKKDSNLKITRMNRDKGLAKGEDDLFILCEKIDKDDIQVVFYQENQQGLAAWTGYGNFGPLDVHHQIAIVLKTPSYQETKIDRDIEVKISLKRPSDGDMSDPKPFTYIPEDSDGDMIHAKRKRPYPDFEGNFNLTGEGAAGGAKLSNTQRVKKKLHDKIKAKKAAEHKTIQKTKGKFSFQSAANATSTINVRSATTTGHVIVKSEPHPYSLHLPDHMVNAPSNIQVEHHTEVEHHTGHVGTKNNVEKMLNYSFAQRADSDPFTTLSGGQLAELLNHSPTLAQLNDTGQFELPNNIDNIIGGLEMHDVMEYEDDTQTPFMNLR